MAQQGVRGRLLRRREFIAGLSFATTIGHAQAQQTGKAYRMALVRSVAPIADTSEHGVVPFYQAMFAELRKRGYLEGQNLVVERYASGNQPARFAEVAREVVKSMPDIIFVSGNRLLLLALKAATSNIPIVAATSDAARAGRKILRTEDSLSIWRLRSVCRLSILIVCMSTSVG